MAEKLTFRESAVLIIFESFFQDGNANELFENAVEVENIYLGAKTRELVSVALEHYDEIKAQISKFSKRRIYDRIPKLNLAVLVTAIAEILYTKRAPVNVTVSEALKIIDKYGYDNDAKFINGVLGSFTRSL